MKRINILQDENIHRYGRYCAINGGMPLFWNSSGVEMQILGTQAEIEIESHCKAMKSYLSFEVDGLRAQTFSPLNGRHWYSIMQGMSPHVPHHIRVIKETQPFDQDPDSTPIFYQLRTDGELIPLGKKKTKLTFIGDSVTSAEGGRGPSTFQEWVPMAFSSADAYPRLAAERLNADYQVISQCGWGIYCSFDNIPSHSLPRIFDQICAIQHGGEKEYDDSFVPDHVIIALGANDHGALSNPPYVDPVTGKRFHLTDSPEDMKRVQKCTFDFLAHLHEKYPAACLHFLTCYGDDEPVAKAIGNAIRQAGAAGIWIRHEMPANFDQDSCMTRGCRSHPDHTAHKRIAAAVIRSIKAAEKQRKKHS